MPPSKKRKIEDSPSVQKQEEVVESGTPSTNPMEAENEPSPQIPAKEQNGNSEAATSPPSTGDLKSRQERFKALQARAKSSAQKNLKEVALETQRLKTDTSALTAMQRKRDIASHNLLKADTEEAGEDFERKRAWDWTIEESEKWDRRMEKKERHRKDVAFQDYTQDARKIYKRQLREMKPDLEAYERHKAAAMERAAASGGLEVVENEDGELIAVDKHGTFFSAADNTDFVENKPEKAAVDRLVKDLQKAEENRLRKRRERLGKGDDDEDVTFINEKNKQFNQKLARFYNKYTAEIRDSFERGTMT